MWTDPILRLCGLPLTAELEPALIGGLAILMTFGIPIIAILTHHQRKMAEIIRRQPQSDPTLWREVEALRTQVTDLRDQVNELIVKTDQTAVLPPPVPSLEERINS